VDLPEPEAPISATLSPGFRSIVTSDSARIGAPKELESLRIARLAPDVMGGSFLQIVDNLQTVAF
jgi:hypothetical protein